MTQQPQSGIGTTPERARRGKVETTETINAGEIAQRERWPDIVAFMLDEGMLADDHGYAWDDYCRLKARTDGRGNDTAEGWHEQEWLRFQKILGYFHLRVLNALWEWPVPVGTDGVVDAKWRLNRSMNLTRDALSAAAKAAQDARKEIEGYRSTKT